MKSTTRIIVSPEDQSPAHRKRIEDRKRYAQSDKGKAARKRYRESELGRAAARRYAQSERGRATRRQYWRTLGGRLALFNKVQQQNTERQEATVEKGRAALARLMLHDLKIRLLQPRILTLIKSGRLAEYAYVEQTDSYYPKQGPYIMREPAVIEAFIQELEK